MRLQKEFFQRKQFCSKNYFCLLQYVLLSVLIVVIMELLCRRSFTALFLFIANRTGAFLYNCFLVFVTLCISLLFSKRHFWLALVSGLWLGICVANFILMKHRSMPLTAPDIFLMSSVRDIFEIYLSPVALVLLMLVISGLCALIIYIWLAVKKRGWILGFAILHLLVFGGILTILFHSLPNRGILDKTNEFFNLAEAYEENGFAYCFASSLITGGVDQPEDYSSEEVENIVEEQSKELPQTVSDPPNLVFVQLESFFDAQYMKDLTYEYDPIPNFRALKESFPHGLLSVPCVGAGTANTEFEVLTGMNLSHFGVGEYPYSTISDSDKMVSVASVLSGIGYFTHAIHNNNATFYDRHIVYDNFGFDTFTPVEYMDTVEYNPLGWARDSCLTREILKCLETNETSDFVFTVSVQPHGRYPKEPIEGAKTIATDGFDNEERASGFEYYLYELSESDRFVKELTDALSQFPEKTLVVFYGDHLPSFSIQNEELSYGTNQTTEYVIWSNYSIPYSEKNLQTYQLSAYVMEMAGIYEGAIFNLHQTYEYASEELRSYQEDLQTLEYDMTSGEDYAIAGDALNFGNSLRFDVEDVLLRDLILSDSETDSFQALGQCFTPYSVVYVNRKPCATTYLSNTVLMVSGVALQEGDEVSVMQVSAVDPLMILGEGNRLVVTTTIND